MKQRFVILSSLIVALVILLLPTSSGHAQQLADHYVHSTTPTLFFHGFGGSTKSEQYMVDGIMAVGVSKTAIVADVSGSGQVTLEGTIPHNAVNPLVEVNFENNQNTNYSEQGKWAKNVIVKLANTYHFKKINIEAHSMGNLAVMYYLLANAHNKKLPQLQKEVALGGPFDGAMGWNQPSDLKSVNAKTGKPSAMNGSYRKLLPLRHSYPRQVRVLNVYGDLGTGDDSQVSNLSSKSFRYLLNNRPRSYREIRLTGTNVKHELLHHNPQVNQILIKFFWGK
ncbi:alpha/beta hydrolase [Limosilactobacillus sp.]|jgi:uncharacterized alpha/beta hydrolase family protein|uniref:alpha/beta hydrolase n=1 Tax=Limosilactobacillus sp. TaxID=2773925 RepID=UPI0025BFE5B7|nr:alpha/beta hydrolase [Limosilactobacillus sp.]MCH3922730.1 alpha/beta hydrolase [Limosilactobacillus sp.]MCH3927413.1 alpha/beta hydrolase [Limosilactobacillus sp.]